MTRKERFHSLLIRIAEQAVLWLGTAFTIGFIAIIAGLIYHIITD